MLSSKLKLLRIEKGFSQLDIVRLSGIGRWRFQLIETGYCVPNSNEIEALSKILKISSRKILAMNAGTSRKNKEIKNDRP